MRKSAHPIAAQGAPLLRRQVAGSEKQAEAAQAQRQSSNRRWRSQVTVVVR
jgi:hypothetical protein